MKKSMEWKTVLPIGVVCILAGLLHSGIWKWISPIAVAVPYLTFCICSFIVYHGKIKRSSILKILLVGIVCLPIFDFVYSRLASSFGFNLISAVAIVFLQTCVYLAAFVIVNAWICGKKKNFNVKTYIFLAVLILLYAILEVMSTIFLLSSVNEALGRGDLISWLNVLDNNILLNLISKILLYGSVFCVSVKMVQKN